MVRFGEGGGKMSTAAELLPLKMYRDLCDEISCLYLRIEQLEIERKYYWKMGTKPVKAPMPLDRALDQIYKIDDALRPLYRILDDKEFVKMRIEKTLGESNSVEHQVAYWRLRGLPLAIIAEKLGYSLGYVKNISSRVKTARVYNGAVRERHRNRKRKM
jgi:hypothetical protein